MKFKRHNVMDLADLICGNPGIQNPSNTLEDPAYFPYRSSSYISMFFEDIDTEYRHDGTTRNWWIADVLDKMLNEPHDGPEHPPEIFCRVVDHLMDPADALNEGPDRSNALQLLNKILTKEGFEAFYGDDGHCYVRHVRSRTISALQANPHRPLTLQERQRRKDLSSYLDTCTEDDLIEEILLPLLRQLGFHRITAAGHKDKALEYGKDVWMRYTLPTQHYLYFAIQAKKGKLDASGVTKTGNANIAEIHHQTLMMLAHEIFDPETNRRVLVDHAFIVAGGEITKQARNWIGNALDAAKRSQIMFIDRDDILNLYVVTNLPLPERAFPAPAPKPYDDPPF